MTLTSTYSATAATVSGVRSPTANKITLPPISSFDHTIRSAEYHHVPINLALQSLSSSGLSTPYGSSRQNSAVSLDSTFSHDTVASSVVSSMSNSSYSAKSRSHSLLCLPSTKNGYQGAFQKHNNQFILSSSGSSESLDGQNSIVSPASVDNKVSKKQRKKKECQICHNFYANLSTHKSTHLTPENRPHKCDICGHGFARNNDLIRHKKRHWKDEFSLGTGTNTQYKYSDTEPSKEIKFDQLKSLHSIKGSFRCPFNSTLIKLDMELYSYKSMDLNFDTSNCHQTGIFSRCDTYKNHLKALHFEYPPGTKKVNRSAVAGRCRHCGKKFPNVNYWLKNHVTKTCGYSYH
ncbi:hypothetical protein TPHA_0B00930 [Tetrapisispora phaffii CBS 4417]|uniref:C2H2-type domain-containing protein n=1 Tax=Tetrapisispora phaffii (strain ATCC 24235 / CBS 4417 / NBRC 1672 / NRRL Y-8282 / UCD 70-5) TaxID=1071381 RepID=G8BQG8_TETPH|nr:hypothetical protein TPHA_0B00930 [Tetrapisispora phaffii CBS 4417]CCE61765.1 hypothetical protein TPHA_0B00930 [Tetrapisispora phaffii CBS 4417]